MRYHSTSIPITPTIFKSIFWQKKVLFTQTVSQNKVIHFSDNTIISKFNKWKTNFKINKTQKITVPEFVLNALPQNKKTTILKKKTHNFWRIEEEKKKSDTSHNKKNHLRKAELSPPLSLCEPRKKAKTVIDVTSCRYTWESWEIVVNVIKHVLQTCELVTGKGKGKKNLSEWAPSHASQFFLAARWEREFLSGWLQDFLPFNTAHMTMRSSALKALTWIALHSTKATFGNSEPGASWHLALLRLSLPGTHNARRICYTN